MSKLTTSQRLEIKNRINHGESLKDLADEFHVTYMTIYFIKNPHIRANKESNSRQVALSIHKARIKAMDLLGGKCKRCGFSDIRALQIDHIHGGGTKEIKKIGSYKVYLKIVNNYSIERNNYQLLCANCNWIKRHENNEQGGRISYSQLN